MLLDLMVDQDIRTVARKKRMGKSDRHCRPRLGKSDRHCRPPQPIAISLNPERPGYMTDTRRRSLRRATRARSAWFAC